jgi:hypothetical protein
LLPDGGGRKDKGEGGQIWWKYFAFMYENGTMRPFEMLLRRGEGR